MAWLRAQDNATRLFARRGGGGLWHTGSFEHRSVHDVLALTLLFSRYGSELGPGRIALLRALLADDVEWVVWCQGHLTHDTAVGPQDVEQAARSLGWLTGSRLLAGSLYDAFNRCTVDASRTGAGVSVGVSLARRLLDVRGGRQQRTGWLRL